MTFTGNLTSFFSYMWSIVSISGELDLQYLNGMVEIWSKGHQMGTTACLAFNIKYSAIFDIRHVKSGGAGGQGLGWLHWYHLNIT